MTNLTPVSIQGLKRSIQDKEAAIVALEDEVSAFLEDYHTQTAHLMEQLVALRKLAGLHPMHDDPQNQAKSSAEQAAQLKALYHELARHYHPDHGNSQDASGMSRLNVAYREQDVSMLWKLKWESTREQTGGTLSHAQRRALYSEQSEDMKQYLEAMQQRETDLKNSDAYRLMRHAQWLNMSGVSFIEQAKQHMQEEIMRAKYHAARKGEYAG